MNIFTLCIIFLACLAFILSVDALSHPKSAGKGQWIGVFGIGLAIFSCFILKDILHGGAAILALLMGSAAGAAVAYTSPMTVLPQIMALFHSLVGLAAVCVAGAIFLEPEVFELTQKGFFHAMETGLGGTIGAFTFTGSLLAFAKLQGYAWAKSLPSFLQTKAVAWGVVISILGSLLSYTLYPSFGFLLLISIFASAIGGKIAVWPIGGADMPVVISLLNAASGWAAVGLGFSLHNPLLVVVGCLVGASGAILSYVMSKGMNRPLWDVISRGWKKTTYLEGMESATTRPPARIGGPEDVAFILQHANSVIIVPGYGMAVAHAQHAIKDLAKAMEAKGIRVRYAIHPVAGRMPGHMNVLLAEAGIPYESVFELDTINGDFASTDVAIVIGANDVTNPLAKDPESPIYGMPVLEVEKSNTVVVIKRSMAPGYAGIDNPLFYEPNVLMLFGDAKAMCEAILRSLHAQ